MRLLIWGLLLMGIATGAEWKVDHATIAGPNLKGLRELLDRAGLRTEYGGEHSSRQTEMAIMSFPDGSYLELIGQQAGAERELVRAHRPLEHQREPMISVIAPQGMPPRIASIAGIPVAKTGC